MERESPSAAKQGDKPMELPIKAWLEERGGSKITDHPLEGKKIGEENGGRPFFVQDYFPEGNRFTHSFSPLSLSLFTFFIHQQLCKRVEEKSLFEFSDYILVGVCG